MHIFILIACLGSATSGQAEPSRLTGAQARNEVSRLREEIIQRSQSNWRIRRQLQNGGMAKLSSNLAADGTFSDLAPDDHAAAFQRLHALAAGLATAPETAGERDLKLRVYRGLLEYSRREAANPTRFPKGAFLIPKAFLGSWFALYDQIEQDLQEPEMRPLLEELRETGGKVATQAWVYPDHSPEPFRSDNPLSIEVFRGQGHFVVANFVQYRPVLEYAVFLGDPRYVAMVEEVAKRSLGEPVNPADPAAGFWTEGIHPDRNITAHGPQTYIFGYGRDYLRGLITLAELFDGGPHAFERKEFDVITDVMLDAFVWFIYRDQMDYTILGRHNLYPNSGHGGHSAALTLIEQLLAVADGRITRMEELLATRDRLKRGGEFSGSKYFWNSEAYVHRSKDFCVVVNTNSIRTTGPENVKPWAEQNFHFGNGVMMVYLDGIEYGDVRGAWNLRALPGITAEFSEQPPPYVETWNGIRGAHRFAGGVSDGVSGACAFVSALEGEKVRARKAWFFHENTVVCLGSGIEATEEGARIRTTLNQAEWRSPIYTASNGENRELPFDGAAGHALSLEAPVGFWQDGVSYLVQTGAANLSAAVRPTDWVALAEANNRKPAPEEAAIFDLSLAHGGSDGSSYAYAVRPRTTSEDMVASLESPGWKVVANTPEVQAVEFAGADLVQAVFRKPGAMEASSLRIETNRPVIVMLRSIADRTIELTYQDPLHQKEETAVQLDLVIRGERRKETVRRLTLDLPQGIDLGKPVRTTVRW